MSRLLEAVLGTAVGLVSSSLFIPALIIGRGPADQLRTPELKELAQRKS